MSQFVVVHAVGVSRMSDPISDTFDVERLIQGFTAPALQQSNPDRTVIDVAEHNARQWTSNDTGPLKPGSDEHRREMCRMFRETFNPYRPSVLEWPELEPDAAQRIVSLPIWDIAVQTEGRARLHMAAYAATVNEPDVREALALNAWEESRHKDRPEANVPPERGRRRTGSGRRKTSRQAQSETDDPGRTESNAPSAPASDAQ